MSEEQPDFTSLLGTKIAERAFLDAWNSGRVPHAWLIAGPKGVGKASFAMRVARFVLAQKSESATALFDLPPTSLDVSPDHPVLRRIAARSHADLRILERGWTDDKKIKRKSEIPVEDIRNLGSFMSMTPAEGGWRVVIIDSADEMNRNSANALLKTLEEPPSRALILLISHNPGKLLPTIRSRCRRLDFHPLPDRDIETLLQQKVVGITPNEVALAVEMAEGSIGRALVLHEQGGLSSYQDMLKLVGSLPQLDILALHAFAERVGKDESSFRSTADLLLWWLGKAATDYARQGKDEADKAHSVAASKLVGITGLDRWIEVWDKTAYSFGRTETVALDRKQVIINAFLALERACRA